MKNNKHTHKKTKDLPPTKLLNGGSVNTQLSVTGKSDPEQKEISEGSDGSEQETVSKLYNQCIYD